MMNQKEEGYSNTKQHIKTIIIGEIKEQKSNLVHVKFLIEKTFDKHLSSIDEAYIEKKYIKYCSEFWLQEITEFLKRTTESKSCTLIKENFSSLDKIKSLENIPNFCKQLEYYQLLIQHYKLVSKKNEKNLIHQFKKKYLEQIVAYSDSAENELVFLETFVDFLSFSECFQSIIAELKLKEFCCGELSFSEFLKRVIDLDESIYGSSITALQEVAQCLQEEKDLFLIGTFKEVIGDYIKPVEIQESIIDDRLVIEVTGKNVVVSDILCRLENILLEKSKIEEVRFVGADVIHIDTNLNSKGWRGKNIAILTKAIKIHDKVTWDVSGKDNSHIYNRNAGTGDDGHGKQGKDGYPGESGGNVLILVEKIENPENFIIISNGGKGSKGQDGGNGSDGKEGKSISKAEFDRKFPFVADNSFFFHFDKFVNTVGNIKKDSMTVETVYSPEINKRTATINDYLSSIRACGNDIFIDSVTSEEGRITFSFYNHSLNRQAFILYKGSLGQPGGDGGEYGLGGQGGYAGEIIVRNLESSSQEFGITKNTNLGQEGEKGKGGLYGRQGNNGLDMGYLYYQWWRQAKFFDQGKFKLEYNDKRTSESVWCPYKSKYARLTDAKNEVKIQIKYEKRKNTRQNSGRQHHAQAVRKKNILQNSILATYSHQLCSIEKISLKDLRSNLENSKERALQAISENQKQQEKHTMELGIKRSVSSVHQYKKNPRNYTITPSGSYKDTTNVEGLINKLKAMPLLIENQEKNRSEEELRGIELTRSELDELFSNFETVKKMSLEELRGSRWRWLSVPGQQSAVENKLKNIEQLLIDKYRLATLQEIAKQLPYDTVTDDTEVTLKSAARYLVEGKEVGSNIPHDTLGTLNQYICNNSQVQRIKIFTFFEKRIKNKSHGNLKSCLKTFISEVGNSEEAPSCIKKYCEKPERITLKDTFYKYFWPKTECDQDKTWKDQDIDIVTDINILNEYKKYIVEKGPLLKSYMELLAYVFKINIRLYTEDQDNRLSLQDNHNSLSKTAVHVLHRGNEFVQLNGNYLNLEKEYKKNDYLYAKILKKIETFKQKQEFDEYLADKAFLTDNAPSEDQQYFEEEDIKKIIEYFTEEEMQQLKPRLEKITLQYSGQQGILHYVLKRFSSDGKHVSYQELCYLINSILTFSIEERKLENTFCWIVAAHSQRNWIDELILLQLENHFKRQLMEKSKWREHLSKIENKDVLLLFGVKLDQGGSISTQCIENTLHLLSNISCEVGGLEGLELSEWPYILKEAYWSCKLLSLTNWQDSEKLPTASYYLLAIENIFGTNLVEKLLGALEEKKQELTSDILTNILSHFYNEKWNLSEEVLKTIHNCNISEWGKNMQQKFTTHETERDIQQLVKLIEGNANTSRNIADNLLTIADSIKCICDENYVIGGRSVGSFTENDIENWVKDFESSCIYEGKQDIEKKMLAVIDRAIELKRGFKLRDTQRLTVLTLLANNKSTLAQVSTGEGKSLIVVAVALMKALLGDKVDIITSSSVLAKRDAEDNRDIYNLFGINVSHNCSEDIEKRKDAYSSNQIVYGDLSNFQRDYLLDRFYGKHILGDHTFANIIVDEVDSMLLDKGNNMLYLSHDLAGLDKLESVYIYIWQWINRPAIDHEDIAYAFDIKAISDAVINDLYGLVKKEDIGKLGSELSEQHKIIIWERLVKAGILDNQGKLVIDYIDYNKTSEILLPEFSNYEDRLNYLLLECIEREKLIHVPNHLRSFVEKNLESWINSATTAFFMIAGQDYVVDVDRTGTSPDRNPNITILDRDTGTDQANSQWDDALHQFLQLKHGCKLSLQSLKAVFISNVSFFKLYRNLYGLTGTLGSQIERELLQEIHKIHFVTIPTAKSVQFHEDKPILCSCQKEWINQICSKVNKLTKEKKRSVLIICETVNDVEVLHKALGGKDAKHVHTYIRDYEEFHLARDNKRLDQGQIIIATNLAGRGTDIKISEELREAGGLHVCLTYLPSNIRVEQQAFGRAARCGDKGSGQLIIIDSKGQEYSNSRILDLKKERDGEELFRISNIKAYYETQIKMEENCFKEYKMQYEQLNKKLDDEKIPTEVKEILLQSCLDKWAFWLDENSKYIKNVTDEESKSNFNNLLVNFISELEKLGTSNNDDSKSLHDSKSWLAWVDGNPAQMMKLGKYLSQNKEHENAIKLFDEVIKKEPYFSEAAHYYKAFAILKIINDWKQTLFGKGNEQTLKEFKEELRKAARLFNEHSKNAIIAAGIIGKIKKKNNGSIIQIDAYEEQKKNVANLYYMFSQSVDDIFGHTITPQSFVNYDVNEELAERLYKDLLEEGILKKPKVKKNISEEKLKTISYGYGILVETLKSFLSRHQEINMKHFQKTLKRAVTLPSREAFWKLLIQEEVLCEEVKYVVVDSERLREFDPSLMDFLTEKDLKKQTVVPNNKQILLYVEWISQSKNNSNVFEKGDFIKVVGKSKYNILKEKKVLTFNKKAVINPSKIESVVLPRYDSITIEDFTTKANITKSEAEKILAELVEQQVLEKKDDSDNSAYGLNIKFDEILQIQLLSCPVYETVVRRLLSVCFTYRIVLQRIVKQQEGKKFPICLQLSSKPHQSLVFDLLEQRIIRPTMVASEAHDLPCIKKIVEKVLDNLSHPAKEDTVKHIVSTLKRSRSSLKVLKVPDSKLKPLTQVYGQSKLTNIEEVNIFFLNGLDMLQQLEEKKWTLNMILSTLAVTAMGICQIVIGILIVYFSKGIMTRVGTELLCEGMSDLYFAAEACRSGYFSWEDYGQNKLINIMMTAVTTGIGVFFSKASKASGFGTKLAKPTVEVGGKITEQMSTSQLPKNKALEVGKKMVKHETKKAIKGVVFGLASTTDNLIIEKKLKALCNDITSSILSNIDQEVERHIFSSLGKAYETLGEESARKMVNDLSKSVFTEQNWVKKLLPVSEKIVSNVAQGIASNKSELLISSAKVWSERDNHISNITTMVGNLLNILDDKIKKKLEREQKKNSEQDSLNQKRKDCEEFMKEMTDQFKSLLCEKAEPIISQHIITPILKEGEYHRVKYVKNKLQAALQTYKESGSLETFEALKQEYNKKKLQSEEQCDNTFKFEDYITKKYHKNLLKLMNKTRNPDLLADIVRENIPMDMACVSACTQVIHKVLKDRGVEIPGLNIFVEGDNGIKQKILCGSARAEVKVINLTLLDNHFKFYESGASENNSVGESINNCLYEALAEASPQIRDVTPERFRAEVVNCIKRDEEIRNHIQKGAFDSGARIEQSASVPDSESSSFNHDLDNGNNDDKGYGIHKVAKGIHESFKKLASFIRKW